MKEPRPLHPATAAGKPVVSADRQVIKLRFGIEHAMIPAVRRGILAAGGSVHDMQACCLDTASGALASRAEPLKARARASVKRWTLRLTAAQACVDISLDVGVLRSGRQSKPVREMAFELHSGDVCGLAAVCRDWVERYGLWLVHESTAAQGERLRNRTTAPPVVKSGPSSVQRGQSGGAMLRAVLRDCLAQVVPNAAALAEGSRDAEHVHQLRVGLRRLRTGLKELHKLAPDGGELIGWKAPLGATFRALGELRDRQAVVAAMSHRLAAVGALDVPWLQSDGSEDLSAMVRNAPFQTALMSALVYALAGDDIEGQANRSPRGVVRMRLKALHGSLLKGGKHFRKLPIHLQHRERKRLKRMRYLTEFVQALFKTGAVDNYLACMRPAHEELGLHNDYAVALSLLDQHAVSTGDRNAVLAATWLKKKLKKSARRSQAALLELSRAPRFWKRRPN